MINEQTTALNLDIKKNFTLVFSTLVSAARPLGNRNEAQELPLMPAAERPSFVESHWGAIALQKVSPYLDRIAVLESQLNGDSPPVESPAELPAESPPDA